jgi:hypothetical protein
VTLDRVENGVYYLVQIDPKYEEHSRKSNTLLKKNSLTSKIKTRKNINQRFEIIAEFKESKLLIQEQKILVSKE